ncbi:hypothetical protein [Yeosuana marina]|uniref:AbiU2 domain-containing protein n=1 Tax=Yeosuana marina TaxID=1565536 RepID=UPI0030C7BF41
MNNTQQIIKKLFNIWLHTAWKLIEFEKTFPENEEIEMTREELLPDFFDNLNELYWNYFFVTIAKLLDPHNQGQNKNLSLFTLPELLKSEKKIEWKIVSKKVQNIKEKYKSIIVYRSKKLAHFDFDYNTGKKEFNTSTHINEINDFFTEMLEVINLTLKILEIPEYSPGIMRPADYKGADELNKILADYKKNTMPCKKNC